MGATAPAGATEVSTCKSCGDPVERVEFRAALLKRRGEEMAADEILYCLECANELFRGRIAGPYRRKPRGPQTPRPGNPSPARENAVRALEER